MSQHETNPLTTRPLRMRAPLNAEHQYRMMLTAMLMLSLLMAIGGLVGGFMYGDSYGRKHAQYDNPTLREYYAGQCYAFWENQFKKTVRVTLDQPRSNREETQRLDEIRMMLQDLQHTVSDLSAPRPKKKMAAVHQGPAS